MTPIAPNNALLASSLFSSAPITTAVTGGGTGIGLTITETLAANGARLYITGRRAAALENVASRYYGNIIPVSGNLASPTSLEALVATITKQSPDGIQLLVNNAGVAPESATTFFAPDSTFIDLKNSESVAKHLPEATRES